jgi:hypothetical protein
MELIAKRITTDTGEKYVVVFQQGCIFKPMAILTEEKASRLARDLGSMKIGRYTLTQGEEGKVFLQHGNGEVADFDEKKLAKLLDKFWDEEF